MTNKEILEKKIELLDKEDFIYTWTNEEREAVKELLKENKSAKHHEECRMNDIWNMIAELDKKNFEIYKLNNELKELKEIEEEHRKENGKLKEIVQGKTIQEIGTSKLYKED